MTRSLARIERPRIEVMTMTMSSGACDRSLVIWDEDLLSRSELAAEMDELRALTESGDHYWTTEFLSVLQHANSYWTETMARHPLERLGDGETRESVDQIILEAMFGLGSGFKMRDVANSIIQAAGLLPGRPPPDEDTP